MRGGSQPTAAPGRAVIMQHEGSVCRVVCVRFQVVTCTLLAWQKCDVHCEGDDASWNGW
jgi:hypothetical protein